MNKEIEVNEIKVSEEYKELVPRPTKEQYQAIKEDIKKNGITVPLIVNDDNKLIDGFTRLRIAKELGITKVPIQRKSYKSKFEEKRDILTLNLNRRHLSIAQRADIGVALMDIEKESAKERKGTRTDIVTDLPPSVEFGKVRDKAAKKVKVSPSTLQKAKKITEAAKHDTDIDKSWDDAKDGKGSVDSVYKKVMKKERGDKGKEDKETFEDFISKVDRPHAGSNSLIEKCIEDKENIDILKAIVKFSYKNPKTWQHKIKEYLSDIHRNFKDIIEELDDAEETSEGLA